MTNQTKPKCGVGQSCGYSCISIKDTCSDKIDPGTSAGLINLVQNAALYKAKSLQSFTSAADEGKTFDELAAKYPFKAGVGQQEKIGDLSIWYLTMEASDGSGDKMTYAVAEQSKKSFTLSDGNVKEVLASDRNAKFKEALAAALRAKATDIVNDAVTATATATDTKQKQEALVPDVIAKDKADELSAAATKQATAQAPDASLAKASDKESRSILYNAQKEWSSAVRMNSTTDPDYAEDAKDWARELRPGFTEASVSRLSEALRFKGVESYYPREIGPALAFKANGENFSDKGHDVWPNLNQAAVSSLIEDKSSSKTRDALAAMSEAAGVSLTTAETAARAFAKHISDGFVTREATLSVAMGGDTAKALDEFYAKAPKFKGKIYRGMSSIDPALLEQWQKTGLQQDLLTSWTSSESVGKKLRPQTEGKYTVVLEAENKTGISARAFAVEQYKYQDEVIGKPNTNYDILSIEDRSDVKGRPYKHVIVRER